MAKTEWFPKRKTDYRPSLWIFFWICLSMYLFGVLMSQPVQHVYYPFTLTLPGSADG